MSDHRIRVRTIDNRSFFTDVVLALNEGRSVVIRAKGWSMLPLLWSGRDKLTISPLTENSIQVGRIVLVHLEGERYVVHRIECIEGERITLRGDGNVHQREECTRSQVLGEMTSIIREGKRINLGDPLWQRIEDHWPSSPLVRRILLAIYRRIFRLNLRKKVNKR